MKLLVLDVEGTLFKTSVRLPGTTIDSTIWQGIANALGADAIEAEIQTHRNWHEGKYKSYLDWMADTITIHQRRPHIGIQSAGAAIVFSRACQRRPQCRLVGQTSTG